MPYEIGTLYVRENRDKSGSRLIGLGFARVRAAYPTGAPPIFLLAGDSSRSLANTSDITGYGQPRIICQRFPQYAYHLGTKRLRQ